MKRSASSLLCTVLAAAVLLPSTNAAEFVVDPTLSSVTLSGNLAGFNAQPQGPGSLTSEFSGTIQVEIDDAAGTVNFPGGTILDAAVIGDYEPAPGGEDGTAPADFAGSISLGFLGSGIASLRNVVFDATTPGPIPLTAQEFDAAFVLFQFSDTAGGALDYQVNSILSSDSGSEPLAGYATNEVATTGSITQDAEKRTLTIPIYAKYVLSLLADGDTQLYIEGQLVAVQDLGGNSPPPTLGSVAISNGNLEFSWPSQPGQTFIIQSSASLLDWALDTEIEAGPGDTTTWSAPIGDGHLFYRVGQ